MKQADDILRRIATGCGARAAILASGDGFPLENAIIDNTVNPESVAVIAGDAVSAARKLFGEMDGGKFIQGIFEYTNGAVLIANLPRGAYLIVLGPKGADKSRLWDAVAANFRDLLNVV